VTCINGRGRPAISLEVVRLEHGHSNLQSGRLIRPTAVVRHLTVSALTAETLESIVARSV